MDPDDAKQLDEEELDDGVLEWGEWDNHVGGSR